MTKTMVSNNMFLESKNNDDNTNEFGYLEFFLDRNG